MLAGFRAGTTTLRAPQREKIAVMSALPGWGILQTADARKIVQSPLQVMKWWPGAGVSLRFNWSMLFFVHLLLQLNPDPFTVPRPTTEIVAANDSPCEKSGFVTKITSVGPL